jgi:hypothetical protein
MKTVLHILLFFAAQAGILGLTLPTLFNTHSTLTVGLAFVITVANIVWLCDVTQKLPTPNLNNPTPYRRNPCSKKF